MALTPTQESQLIAMIPAFLNGKRITQLPDATSVNGWFDKLEITQGGISKNISPDILLSDRLQVRLVSGYENLDYWINDGWYSMTAANDDAPVNGYDTFNLAVFNNNSAITQIQYTPDGSVYLRAGYAYDMGSWLLAGGKGINDILDTLALADSQFYAKSIEAVAYNAVAPVPVIPIGATKTYEFISAGVCSWLGNQSVRVGDLADITRTGESTWTRTYRDVTSSLNASSVAINSKLAATLPVADLYARVLADSGTQFDLDSAMQAFEKLKASDPSTVFTFMPHLASKIRTSGVNRYMNKMYSAKSSAYDAVQATDAVQPFATLNADPNSKVGVQFVAGQAQTGLLDFADKAYAAGDSWTLTVVVKTNKRVSQTLWLAGNSTYVDLLGSGVAIKSNNSNVLSCPTVLECGKTHTIEFQYSNGTGLIKINNIPQTTTAASLGITFGSIYSNLSYPFDGTLYYAHLRDGVKSAYQSQLDYTVLRGFFPEIEGVSIGNQHWATSNLSVLQDGAGNVIPEVQGATTGAELLTVAADRDFTADTGFWSKGGETTIDTVAANARIYSSAGALSSLSKTMLTIGKQYLLSYEVISNAGGSLKTGSGFGAAGTGLIDSTVGVKSNIWFMAANTAFEFIRNSGVTDIRIDNISIKEAGASDATNIYNYVYAATIGTTAVKELAANKAAAMLCSYNNDPANAAVYGREYNGYAKRLLDLYPPIRGWRVPTLADATQLSTYLGGNAVSGGKMKALFGGFNNASSSNESGLSATPSGLRESTGAFYSAGARFAMHISDNDNGILLNNNDTEWRRTSYVVSNSMANFFSIRLIRNEPAGDNEKSYTSGLFTTDIISAAKQVPISFGRSVDYIRIKSENALTAIEAKLYNTAGVAVATLITGKTIGAGETKMFSVSADWVSLLQDGTVRVTAAGNSGTAVGMEIEVLTHKGALS